mmetsp:Transcript_3406/g.6705  ORF Transcript_3406/g.6705 Transcript_3406/m.6705 type:complete len:284 (-) Transcript_3406:646-1497(-)
MDLLTPVAEMVLENAPASMQDCLKSYFHFSVDDMTLLNEYTWSLPIIFIVAYLVVLFGGKAWMKNREPFQLSFIYPAWNFFLWVLSVAMFLGLAIPLAVHALSSSNPMEFFCDPEEKMWQPGSQLFWIYVFALSKFIELGDTVLLVMRKKPVIFLHWYHHITVLAYTWMAVYVRSDPGWIHGGVNALVHSFMYYYYWRAAVKKAPSWGRYLTLFQTTQMIVGITVVGIFFTYNYFGKPCTCDQMEANVVSSVVMYASYFVLFAQLYMKKYTKKDKKKEEKKSE